MYQSNLYKEVTLILAIFLMAAGCNPRLPAEPTQPSPTTSVATPSPVIPTSTTAATTILKATATEPSAPSQPAKEHRIGIREVDGKAEFYDRMTGERFIPRGYNYIQVAPMSATNPGLWHATLNPGFYDPELASESLSSIHAAGYNVVRIFIDCCREGNNAGDPKGGLSQPYLDNVIDFLHKAEDAGVFVLMVMDLSPAQGGYDDMWAHCCSMFDGENLRYLTSGGNSAERRFNFAFIKALYARDAPIDMIFGYDLNNEVHISMDKPPLSLKAGKVATANGESYDMGLPEDKPRMVVENLVYWIDQQRANILAADPTALVTASFPAINPSQDFINPTLAIYQSSADFIDLHTYLGWGISLQGYLRRYEFQDNPLKPVILGELGASTWEYKSADAAAEALVKWQVESCAYGFDGWLLWTYNVNMPDDLWHGDSEQVQIHAALSPAARPDPCE